MEVVIEKGVPVPERRGKWADILSKMAVDDSFTFDSSVATKNTLRVAASRMGISLTFRDEEATGRTRVWRLADKKTEQSA
jgi:hypothetical protein